MLCSLIYFDKFKRAIVLPELEGVKADIFYFSAIWQVVVDPKFDYFFVNITERYGFAFGSYEQAQNSIYLFPEINR